MFYLTPLRRYTCFSCSNYSCKGQWLGCLSIYFPMKWFESFLFLSSSPRALARKGKPTNAIVWITLTVQSLESQHCNMDQYSMNELTDMHLVHGCANHDTEGKRFKFPHPLLWRNEASLLDQRRTMYFPFALFAYTVCCRCTEQCFSVLRIHKSDAVDGSSGRRYVTDQWHNVPLLRARALDHGL